MVRLFLYDDFIYVHCSLDVKRMKEWDENGWWNGMGEQQLVCDFQVYDSLRRWKDFQKKNGKNFLSIFHTIYI